MPKPTERDSVLDASTKIIGTAARREKRCVDAFDIDAAAVRGLDAVCDLDQLMGGKFRIGEGAKAR